MILRSVTVFIASFILIACEPTDVTEASIWMICDEHKDICDATHSGALCSIQRSDTIRALAVQKLRSSSVNAYLALKTLDTYGECLENAFVSETVRNKEDKQSQINTIRKITELQKDILASTRTGARPEVNLWLWQRSQNEQYFESMRNGVELADQVHQDVYVALMLETAKKDLEGARAYAKMVLERATIIADIEPRIYEFYVGYYMNKEQYHKAAVWQGLYSALDKEKAKVNQNFFGLYDKLNQRQLKKAQDEVDDLLFDAKWLNKKMDAFPKKLI